jgi:hypothetical protein
VKIEAVITCVGYGDYLAETLPRNLPHFDRVVVVTTDADRETQEVCRRLSAPYHTTEVFYKNGATFDKARGIDFGLGFLRHADWVVHLDADTHLPPMTRRWLENRPLDPSCIYGVDRVDCVGYDAWRAMLDEGHTGHDYNCRVKVPRGMPLLDRIALVEHGGYVPIGYFQMWHSSTGKRYPIAAGTAERDDVLHSLQWGEGKRRLIPEVVAVHLTAGPAALGANWRGRTTPRFGPPVRAEASAGYQG